MPEHFQEFSTEPTDKVSKENASAAEANPEHRPGRSTGPRTPEGKANSSQNRLIHGLRSEKTVLRTESQEEFDANMQFWLDRYPTEDELIRLLVIQTAKAYWFLLRAQKRLEDVEFQLPENAYHWTDTYQQLLVTFFRYKTTAERTFLRFLKELEARVPEPATPHPSLPTDHAPPVTPHSPDLPVASDTLKAPGIIRRLPPKLPVSALHQSHVYQETTSINSRADAHFACGASRHDGFGYPSSD